MLKSRYFQTSASSRPLADINMIPLIDVMLVLLVIFIITAPLLTHTLKVNLPVTGQSSMPAPPPQPPLILSIKANGSLFIADDQVSRIELQQALKGQSQRDNQREIHLEADENVPYRVVAETLSDAANAGLYHIGFINRDGVAPK